MSTVNGVESVGRIRQMWEDEDSRAKAKRYPDGFPALPPLPAGRYWRQDFHDLEITHLWRKCWLFAAMSDEIPAQGSFKTVELVGVPVVLVRGPDDSIRAFHNTCQHRGARLVTECAGKAVTFRCRYHCWTYNLDGTLRFVPDEHDFAGLERSRRSLRPLRCERHGNLVFVSFDLQAEPLATFLGSLAELLADVPWDKVRLYQSFTWDVECNWKCIHDAFSETYHVKYVHPSSVNAAINQLHTARHMLRNGHNAMVVKNRAAAGATFSNVFDRRDGNAAKTPARPHLNPITRDGQRSYNIFPNLTVPIAENLFPILSVWPLAVDRCRVQLYYIKLSADDAMDTDADRQTVEFFSAILQEDLGAIQGMQDSLANGGIDEIPLCYGEQFLYNFHREIDRMIGPANIPVELRVGNVDLPLL